MWFIDEEVEPKTAELGESRRHSMEAPLGLVPLANVYQRTWLVLGVSLTDRLCGEHTKECLVQRPREAP